MGIKKLSMVIGDHAPEAMKEHEMKNLFGRKVAIDASMSMYQFMVAVRAMDRGPGGNGVSAQLTNENGEVTSHLQGMFHRTIRMVEHGIKPCYVFDGAPPQLKRSELDKRNARAAEATAMLAKATEEANSKDMEKFSRRLVRVTKEQATECKKLLELMGIPVVQASGEAEAQCAALVCDGLAWATATEDMDALTFGSSILLRNMSASAARKLPVQEFKLDRVLQGLDMTMDEFIDLCILLGCDYAGTIRGIGPTRAIDLIKKHRTIEKVLENIDTEKYPVPEDFDYKQARALFTTPDIVPTSDIKLEWTDPDEEGLVQYMVNEKGFSLERIQSGIRKLQNARKKGSQKRLDSFFTTSSTSKPKPAKKAKKTKRK